MFSLPDNIERSLQRVTSSGVIRQLRALSTLDAEANKFDREKWRAQVQWTTAHVITKYVMKRDVYDTRQILVFISVTMF